jgi:DTW domain-containing protein YfiP
MNPRPRCPRCGRPHATCLCDALRPETPRVVVGVLQHPREARVAKSTGTLLPLAFTNAFRLVGIDLDRDEQLGQRVAPFPAGRVAVLFRDGAEPIERAPPDLACLLVPDGSWAQARAILDGTSSLGRLPRYALPPGLKGAYPIRKPQGPGRLSTLEATVAALRILEGDPGAYRSALDLQAALVRQWRARLQSGDARHPAIGTGRWAGRGSRSEEV